MKTIYKYPLQDTIERPMNSKILSVMKQNDTNCLWVEVDTDYSLVERRFVIYGTGWILPTHPGIYIGSVMNEPFVWHVYEVTNVPT